MACQETLQVACIAGPLEGTLQSVGPELGLQNAAEGFERISFVYLKTGGIPLNRPTFVLAFIFP